MSNRHQKTYGKEYEARLIQAVKELKDMMHGEGWTVAESSDFLFDPGEC